jgi:Papain family cysteine protease
MVYLGYTQTNRGEHAVAARKKRTPAKKPVRRTFDARPDTMDFRDRMFVPTLIEVPPTRPLSEYLKSKPPILDQGEEGACTGFGLAAMANYLLRTRQKGKERTSVSPRMLYEMAKRYDEWSGEDYDGSSARGAMKGWFKHGVCKESEWPYGSNVVRLTPRRAEAAASRPLGAYFRVNHKDLTAMHTAMTEVGVLYATATVHTGWDRVGSDGIIKPAKKVTGGHAFLLVGYDEDGFWLQNSWGTSWGKRGFGHVSYADWLENGMDVWVGRLGAPMRVDARNYVTGGPTGVVAGVTSMLDLRPHVVAIGNDGKLRQSGIVGNTQDDVEEIFSQHIPRITRNWSKKRILLYAHGGLVGESGALQRIENYLPAMLDAGIYPIAFVWKTDFWTTLKNILADAFRRRRAEGVLDSTKDFMLDRVDDALEPLARALSGKMQWSEMKENALLSSTAEDGGAALVAGLLATLVANDSKVELHVAGHSAGSIFNAPLVQLLASKGAISGGPMNGRQGLGVAIQTCTLWAPACTLDLFHETYRPAVESRQLKNLAIFNLTDQAERGDHCAHIYNKSLLYLVSNAFENKARIPLIRDGEPILGMDKFVTKDKALQKLLGKQYVDYVKAPNQDAEGSQDASKANGHGDFDDDKATVKATLARILGRKDSKAALSFPRSASSARDMRRRMQ